jgi:hypothetical protein
MCHAALELVGKTLKAAKNVTKFLLYCMKVDSGVGLTNSWLMAQKMRFVGYILSVKPFFSSNFLGLTAEIVSFKLLISHKSSRMEVMKFVRTKEMYFGTEV